MPDNQNTQMPSAATQPSRSGDASNSYPTVGAVPPYSSSTSPQAAGISAPHTSSPADQVEIAPGITARSYSTGSGSPVGSVNVVDLSKLSQEEMNVLAHTGGPPGTIRLFRGIGDSFEQTRGSNFFSSDFHGALDFASGGRNPTMVVVDIPFSAEHDLAAYRTLQSVAGQRMMGFSEGGTSVIELPADWIDGGPVNHAVMRDMRGLGSRLATAEAKSGSILDLLHKRSQAEVRMADSFTRNSGRHYGELSDAEQYAMRQADPGYQAAQRALTSHTEDIRTAQLELTKALPTLNTPLEGATTTALETTALPAVGTGTRTLGRSLGEASVFLPEVVGGVSYGYEAWKHGGTLPQVAGAASFGALDGATGISNAPIILNESGKETWIDRTLGGARMATTSIGTGAGVAIVSSGGTASPVAGPVFVGAIAVNGVLGYAQSAAYELHLAHNPGLVEEMQSLEAQVKAHALHTPGPCGDLGMQADAEMYRAMAPVRDMSTILAKDADLKNKDPVLAAAMNTFNESKFESTARRLETGGTFARELAGDLRKAGPEGDAARKAMAPALQKAGLTVDQYARGLDAFAADTDTINTRMKTKYAEHEGYADVVSETARELQSSMNGGPPVAHNLSAKFTAPPLVPPPPEVNPAWLHPAPLLVPATQSPRGRAGLAELKFLNARNLQTNAPPAGSPSPVEVQPVSVTAVQQSRPSNPPKSISLHAPF